MGVSLKAIQALDWTSSSADLCEKLCGWTIEVVPTVDGSWVDEWGREVLGLTYCEERKIKVGTDAWSKSAITHELIHMAECPWNNVRHLGWDEAYGVVIFEASWTMENKGGNGP